MTARITVASGCAATIGATTTTGKKLTPRLKKIKPAASIVPARPIEVHKYLPWGKAIEIFAPLKIISAPIPPIVFNIRTEKNGPAASDKRGRTAIAHPRINIASNAHANPEPKIFSWDGDIDTIMKPIDSIRYYKHFLQAGMMSMNPQNGHVMTWVGGIDYKNFQYDHVMQSKRQIGSTFKPFLYATAIDQLKLSPCDAFPDMIHCIEPYKYGNPEPWCPTNSSDKYGGMRTLSNALANSKNTISAQLIDKVGPKPVADLARSLGVSSNVPNVPAIALGTPDLSVYEMVGAYGAFANKGIYVKPVMVARIEDKNGTLIYQYKPETRDVLSEESSYVTLNLLEGVTKFGSGARLRHDIPEDERNYVYKNVVTGYPYKFNNAIAGKTGTTQNQSDGWFIGMVPNLVTGVWVGGEDRSIHFEEIAYGQGATMSLPIWGLFMKKCYESETLNVSSDDFDKPENMDIVIDCSKLKPIEIEDESEDINDLLGIGN